MHELETIAVVPGDAARVDVEPDATVRGDPGREVRGADGDVIDAGENRAYFRLFPNHLGPRGRPGWAASNTDSFELIPPSCADMFAM